MKKILIIVCFCVSISPLFAQSTFKSLEQARYRKGDSLEYVSGSKYLIEVSFHVQQGYIDLLNKDKGYKNHFINVMPAEKPNTWRGYSKDTGKGCVFSFLTAKGKMCIVLDDGDIVDMLMVHDGQTNK